MLAVRSPEPDAADALRAAAPAPAPADAPPPPAPADAHTGAAAAPGPPLAALAASAPPPPPLPLLLAPAEGTRALAAITTCYLLFTTTDGALRMVVLFHAHSLGFDAFQVALMFSLYELAGVFTNILAGLAGARWGLRTTLLCGLAVQLASISLLWGFSIAWTDPGAQWKALAYVAAAAGLGGVAKDLVKLGGKTVTKLVTPEERQGRLFALVAWLTGAKNSMKGVGYFVGAASLAVSLDFALGLNLALIALALPIAALGLRPGLGRARSSNVTLAAMLSPAPNVRALSLARALLFGSRDLWFEVALPFYLRSEAQGLGWSRELTGALLAGFIIAYGQVQSATPRLLLRPLRQVPANKLVQVLWNGLLTLVCLALAAVVGGAPAFAAHSVPAMTGALCTLLLLFCIVFAINSAVHSYLIVRYAGSDKVAADIGFYYMSNAAGRLGGVLVSGALYQHSAPGNSTAGLGWCFVASTLASAAATALTLRIKDEEGGLLCGASRCVAGAEEGEGPKGAEGGEA